MYVSLKSSKGLVTNDYQIIDGHRWEFNLSFVL